MKEKIILAVVVEHAHSSWSPDDEAAEMRELIASCGGEVVQTVFCKTQPPTASHMLTKGKVEEIAALCQVGGVDAVVVSTDLKGTQQRNLEEAFGIKTLDRTQVILDIFARRATSLEGKMQVELAQLQYRLPRLTGHGEEMSRLGGGIGTSGPGETKLEVDRRRIGERITRLKKDLKEVTQSRQVKRKKRHEQKIPTLAIVGYTNAGKSTLLNTLTEAGAVVHDGLFTTLDSLSRQALLPNNRKVIFSDTVGFMHALPHGLIEAFKATLEEVQEADLLLHVLDISHPDYRKFYDAVNAVLDELKVMDKPVIIVLNKIDKLSDRQRLEEFKRDVSCAIGISALKGENIQQLFLLIEDILGQDSQEVDIILPADRMDLINLAHSQGQVHEVKFLSDGIHLKASLPAKIAGALNLKQKRPG
ncbi:MAG: GTPase HflX [Candidatus Omnitrophica bacterium]|nr:GTPase HflX [Candidatus Omnitrophota bacterium]